MVTNAKLSLLNNIPYIDGDVMKVCKLDEKCLNIRVGATIGELLKDIKIEHLLEKGDEMVGTFLTGYEWAQVIEILRTDEDLKNLKVKANETLTENGVAKHNMSTCYEFPAGENATEQDKDAVITYRGTAGSLTGQDWIDNIAGAYEIDTEEQLNALKFYRNNAANYKSVSLVGHSKGANKAMYVATVANSRNQPAEHNGEFIAHENNAAPEEEMGRNSNITNCIAVDGQGFSPYFLRFYKNTIEQMSPDIIKNFSASKDFVHILLNHIPYSWQQSCATNNAEISPIQFHSPCAIYMRGEDNMIEFDKDNKPTIETDFENDSIYMVNNFIDDCIANCDEAELDRMVGKTVDTLRKLGSDASKLKKVKAAIELLPITVKLREMVSVNSKAYNAEHPNSKLTSKDVDKLINEFATELTSNYIAGYKLAKPFIKVMDKKIFKPYAKKHTDGTKYKPLPELPINRELPPIPETARAQEERNSKGNRIVRANQEGNKKLTRKQTL